MTHLDFGLEILWPEHLQVLHPNKHILSLLFIYYGLNCVFVLHSCWLQCELLLNIVNHSITYHFLADTKMQMRCDIHVCSKPIVYIYVYINMHAHCTHNEYVHPAVWDHNIEYGMYYPFPPSLWIVPGKNWLLTQMLIDCTHIGTM